MSSIIIKRLVTILSLATAISAKPIYADNGGFNTSVVKNSNFANFEALWEDDNKVYVEEKHVEKHNFWDIETHWAKENIENLIDTNILSGYEDGTFRPDEPMTRAQLASSIQKIFGIQQDAPRKEYVDVTIENSLYYDEIQTIAGAGILNDYGTEFKPNQLITKEEALFGIVQAYKMSEEITNQNLSEAFKDAQNISDWAEDAVNVLFSQGYISAKQDGTFGADDQITRAQFMTLIDNLNQEIITKPGEYKYGHFNGSLLVNVADVTLKNTIIYGDLYLAQGIGEGDITLDNVDVMGTLYVEGGGNGTIYIKSSKIINMVVDKYNNQISIRGDQETEIGKANLESSANIKGEFTLKEAIVKAHDITFEILPEKLKIEQRADDVEEIVVKVKGENITSEDITVENELRLPILEKIEEKIEKEQKESLEEKEVLEKEDNIYDYDDDYDDYNGDYNEDDGDNEGDGDNAPTGEYDLDITQVAESYSDAYTTLSNSIGRYGHVAKRSIFNIGGYLYVSDKIGDELFVKKYDVDGQTPKLLQEQIIPYTGMSIFGGFTMNEDAYFVLSGENNLEEDKSKEVLRLQKYNFSGEIIDTLNLTGSYAQYAKPFNFGDVAMDHNGDILLIHSGKLMFETPHDGLNHQCQMTIEIDTKNMIEKYPLGETQDNHVSHSFNHFGDYDGDRPYAVDLGDAYPRSVTLTKLSSTFDYSSPQYKLLNIPGSVGDNTTGVKIGGFEMASDTGIVVLNKYDFGPNNDSTENRNVRDISLLIFDKSSTSSKEIKLTDYISKGNSAGTPRLVDMGDDRFMVMWSEYILEAGKTVDEIFHYVEIDQYGKKQTGICSNEEAKLSSDALPVYINGKIVWMAKDICNIIDIDSLENIATVETPSADIAGGEYSEILNVTLFTATEGADIYYTINGKVATKDSTPYSGPIEISKSTTLQAMAIKEGIKDSEILVQNYVINQSKNINLFPDDYILTVTPEVDPEADVLPMPDGGIVPDMEVIPETDVLPIPDGGIVPDMGVYI
ncbi:hypothetical protein AN639_09995 [Candidatus Epulonipiscium fishelsonii]|uniref:Uncharacterized protein n=1 Tax=Candidatus Epulonipiscium fishelsonii TaxID=77094 RepID=A0ACC8XA40_9FIRM|nr:hypothetical protein AN396_09605 [Epulopiscium sp. SCG-B11WGA-EpuloA1]ONI43768.1 hypothetical protein AN639_09995 [Epulopiscium sp. SCG-B05WGA-EpuloA1]